MARGDGRHKRRGRTSQKAAKVCSCTHGVARGDGRRKAQGRTLQSSRNLLLRARRGPWGRTSQASGTDTENGGHTDRNGNSTLGPTACDTWTKRRQYATTADPHRPKSDTYTASPIPFRNMFSCTAFVRRRKKVRNKKMRPRLRGMVCCIPSLGVLQCWNQMMPSRTPEIWKSRTSST